MRVLLSLVGVLTLIYVPGTCLRRWLAGPEGGDQPGEHRLLEEILLGAGLLSWIGLVLTELRVFSLFGLAAAAAAVSMVALAVRGSRPCRYGGNDAIGLAIAFVVALWVAPPFDTLIYGSDSSVYEAGGIHLAQTGRLEFDDPTLAVLSPPQRRELLRSLSADGVSPPYLRLPGGFTVAELDSPAVLPAFHHLFMVWTAAFVAIGGVSAAPWAVLLFSGLAVWAVYRFAAGVDGGRTGILGVLLLSACAPQYWYSRFPMPEVPAQFFLWAGLGAVIAWQRSGARHHAVAAAIGFGIAGLMRTENLLFIGPPLLLASLLGWRLPRRQRITFLALTGLLWLHALFHLLIFRTHYVGLIRSVARSDWAPSWLTTGELLGLAGLLIAAVVALSFRRGGGRSMSLLVTAMAVIADVVFLLWQGEWEVATNAGYVWVYVGAPILAAAAVGIVAMRRRRGWALFGIMLCVVTLHVLADPHAQPVPLWVVRRFVPVLLPALCIAAGAALAALSRLGSRWLTAAVLVASVLVPLRQLGPLAVIPLYPRAAGHIQAVAALIPDEAVILADDVTVMHTQILPAIWALHGTPPYLIESSWRAGAAGLVRTFLPRPTYWLSTETQPAPALPGVMATPIASYEFSFPAAAFYRYQIPVPVRATSRINLYRLTLE